MTETTTPEFDLVKLELIDVDFIDTHPHNPRKDVGDVAELAASIGQQGLLEPLLVVPDDARPGRFLLLAGHRRFAASSVAGLGQVPCLIREDLVGDDAGQLQVMLVENLQRTDLTPVEEAEAYQQLLKFDGWDEAKIAATTGRAETTVHARLKLTQLAPKVRNRLQERQITLEQAVAIGEFADDEHGKAFVKDLENAAGTPDWHRHLESAKQHRANAKKCATTRAKLEKAGVKVVTERPGWGAGVERLYQQQVKQHKKCPGYTAWIDTWGDAYYYCIGNECLVAKRDAASSSGKATGGLVSAAEQKAKNAERREDKKKLTAAAEARHAHLAGLVAAGADADPVSDLVEHDDLFTPIARELTRPVIDSLMYRAADRAFVAQVLGIELPSQKGVDSYTFRQRFYDVLDDLPLHRVLMIAAILSYGSVDYQLSTDAALWKARHWRDSRDPYLAFLHRTGYQPTTFETPAIERAVKQAPAIVDVHLPDDDVHPIGEVDGAEAAEA